MNLLDDASTEEPTIDPAKNYLEELVGEGKKFKTPEDMAKGKYLADMHISLLEKKHDSVVQDLIKAREELAAKASLEDLINRVSNPTQKLASNAEPSVKEVKEQPLDMKQFKESVASVVQEIESSKKGQENLNIVTERLVERYGSNYKTALKEQIDTLGLSVEDVNALARKSPKALFKTLGLDLDPRQPYQAPPRSDKSSDSFRPVVQKRTWSYYKDLMKKNPNMYNDRKIMIQMQKDAIELGDAFKDGDYTA